MSQFGIYKNMMDSRTKQLTRNYIRSKKNSYVVSDIMKNNIIAITIAKISRKKCHLPMLGDTIYLELNITNLKLNTLPWHFGF